MKNKLEQLLNSLIERGWKPFGEGCHRSPYKRVSVHKNYNKERTYVLFYSDNHTHWKVLRQVVSKESGLWQFCCENELYPPYIQHRWFRDLPTNGLQIHDYRYWVIESALCDEDKLEDFLLSNINVDVESK